jgi:acetyl-CoA/propionyl-CoA carboxylase biotin carboxyl carrier protein
MLRALGEYEIGGLTTLIPFHRAILATDQWRNAETCRDLLEDPKWLKALAPEEPAKAPDEGKEPLEERTYEVEVDGRLHRVRVLAPATATAGNPSAGTLRRPPKREQKGGAGAGGGASGDSLVSPIQGTVLKVVVEKGAEVKEGALVCVIEAMKMENEITAHRAGKLTELNVVEGASVATGDVLARIT